MGQKLQVMNNDKKYNAYRKKQIIKIMVVLLALGVVVLEILALLRIVSMFWGIGVFIVIQILIKIFLK